MWVVMKHKKQQQQKRTNALLMANQYDLLVTTDIRYISMIISDNGVMIRYIYISYL